MIHIKSQLDMDTYRASAGDLSKRALRLAGSLAKPGTSTKQIRATEASRAASVPL